MEGVKTTSRFTKNAANAAGLLERKLQVVDCENPL